MIMNDHHDHFCRGNAAAETYVMVGRVFFGGKLVLKNDMLEKGMFLKTSLKRISATNYIFSILNDCILIVQ